MTEAIKQKVLEVLDSGYLTEGPVTRDFEQKFANYVDAPFAIAVTSCTTGLEIALRALGIGPGDEVIVPDYTYPATAAVVNIVGAHCKIVDIDLHSMLIDYDKIEQAITPNTKAIIPVSLFGNPLDYSRLGQIKSKYGLFIVEDAACSIGAEFQGQRVGNFADITVFSLHPRKFITTGEGGLITTGNPEWADWMNSYKHFGMDMSGQSREGTHFDIIGTNYKLSNILAAVGLGQFEKIDELLGRRIALAENYTTLLADLDGIQLPSTINSGQHSYQSYCIFVENRDQIMMKMRECGIEVQIGTYSLHMHKAFAQNPLVDICGSMENSRWCFDHALVLPLFHELTNEEQELIVKELKAHL